MRDVLTYQAFADHYFDESTKGKSIPVLRSLRHASQELVLQGTITPVKAKPSASDIDDLCDLFNKKAKVTPSKKKPSGSKVKCTDGENAANEENVSPLKVVKNGGLFDGLVMKGKKETKAESLAKAKAWSDARRSNKTSANDADGAQESFNKALKAVSSAKSTRFETKEAVRTSTRRSAKRCMY